MVEGRVAWLRDGYHGGGTGSIAEGRVAWLRDG